VNSGKFTGGRNPRGHDLKTNIEAADEIARQVRLRDIGGIIVVDFIDMGVGGVARERIRTMEEVLSRDRTRRDDSVVFKLGIAGVTRKRIARTLALNCAGVPTCAGMGSVMSSQSVAIENLSPHSRRGALTARPAT